MYHLVVTRPAKIVILAIIMLFGFVTVAYAEPIMLKAYEFNIKNHFNNWDDDPYVIHVHDCSEMSVEVEQYVETILGFDCLFVYGYQYDDNGTVTTGHIWNIININNVWYEFESTSLRFKQVSNEFEVQDVQHGFYINGMKYDKSQEFEDWEDELFRGKKYEK